MKKRMIKTGVPILVAGVLILPVALVGCDNLEKFPIYGNRFEQYNDSSYSVGNGSASAVSKIEIDWISGDVTVRTSMSASGVTFEEEGSGGEALALRWRLLGGELDLKYAASRAELPENDSKDLTVTLPAGSALSELEIDCVAGDVTIEGLSLGELKVDTASSDVTVRECAFSDAEIDSVSGDVEISLPDIGFRYEFESVSGKLTDEFGAVKQGDDYVYGNGGVEISVDTVSGNFELRRTSGSTQGGGQGGDQGGTQGGTQGGGQGGTQGGDQGGTQGGGQGGTQGGGQGGDQGGTQGGGQGGTQGGTQGGDQGGTQGGTQDGIYYERYDGVYSVGGASVSNVREIEIDWLGGDVIVEASATATSVVFSETGGAADSALRYRVREGELEIKYAASGAQLPSDTAKTLTVTVPASLLELDIEGYRSRISLSGLSLRDLNAETTTGDILVTNCDFLDGEFDSTSGNITLILPDRGFRCEFTTLSGKFTDEFGAAPVRGEYLYGDGRVEISSETVSGNLTLKRA